MAVPHYAYLKMKLRGPHGVITITGCYKKSIECVRASSKLAEALVIVEEKRQLLQRVAAVQPGRPALSQPAPHLKPGSSTKEAPPEAGKAAEALVSGVMSTHASVLVDSVGPPSAEVCRAAASFP
jgi:hypothetical protein